MITGKSAAASLGGAGTNCRYPFILTKKGFILVDSTLNLLLMHYTG